MILFVVGDLDAEEVFECVRKSNHKDIEKLQEEIQKFASMENTWKASLAILMQPQ